MKAQLKKILHPGVFAFFTASLLVFSPLVGSTRTSPFYPSVTAHYSSKKALAFPFSDYTVSGYTQGPRQTIVLVQAPDSSLLYLKPGQVLGKEKFVFSTVQDSQVTFSKTVKNLNGKEETLYRTKEITRK